MSAIQVGDSLVETTNVTELCIVVALQIGYSGISIGDLLL